MSTPARAGAPTRACSRCGDALTTVGGPGEVTHGTVGGVAVGPVAWVCPRAAAEPDRRHDELRPSEEEVATAVRTGLTVARRTAFRGTLRCGVCDTPFALPGRRTTRTVTVTGAAPAVTLTLDVPVLRCTQDAVENLPPEALEDALAVATTLVARAVTRGRPGGGP